MATAPQRTEHTRHAVMQGSLPWRDVAATAGTTILTVIYLQVW
jgi:hypothetical protein